MDFPSICVNSFWFESLIVLTQWGILYDMDRLSAVNSFEINSFIVHTQYSILDRDRVQWNEKKDPLEGK